ncbi:hypothetical protein NXV14_17645 [Bacteroides fragilis]|nr:hypothetical protein [Bacteroides fragilis]MCS2888650.1 hypothetical protein [Bacteroides fragilis]
MVTADTKFYSYSISYNAHPAQSYVRIGGEAPHTAYAAGRKRKAAVPDLPCRYHLRRLRKHERGGGQGRGGG